MTLWTAERHIYVSCSSNSRTRTPEGCMYTDKALCELGVTFLVTSGQEER